MEINSFFVKKLASDLGADLCGIASVERFSQAPQGFHPYDVLPECKSIIVIANRFLRSTLEASSTIPYTTVRNELSTKMNLMAINMAEILEDIGIIAIPANTSGPDEFDSLTNRHRGIISLKHAAVNAGLGKIGKNTLLVNEKYGNMIWLNAVLISKALDPDPMAEYETCNPECNLCVQSCPVGALNGEVINQMDCGKNAFGEHNGGDWRIKCFKCRKVCPNSLGLK